MIPKTTQKSADLRLVQNLVDREIVRLRRKKLPHLDSVVIRVLWQSETAPDLYGEFIGVPESEFSVGFSGELPSEVIVYAKTLIADFGRRDDLAREVKTTLLHELAHALGFSEKGVDELGLA